MLQTDPRKRPRVEDLEDIAALQPALNKSRLMLQDIQHAAAKQRDASSKEAALKAKEDSLRAKEEELKAFEKSLHEREQRLNQQQQQLHAQHQQLKAQQLQLNNLQQLYQQQQMNMAVHNANNNNNGNNNQFEGYVGDDITMDTDDNCSRKPNLSATGNMNERYL